MVDPHPKGEIPLPEPRRRSPRGCKEAIQDEKAPTFSRSLGMKATKKITNRNHSTITKDIASSPSSQSISPASWH